MTKHELREQIDSEIAENERLISFWKEQAKLQADTELGSIAANMVRFRDSRCAPPQNTG